MDIYKTILNLAAASETPEAAWAILQRYVKLSEKLAHEQKTIKFLQDWIELLEDACNFGAENATDTEILEARRDYYVAVEKLDTLAYEPRLFALMDVEWHERDFRHSTSTEV